VATNGATMAAPVRAPGTAVAAITVRRLDVLIGSLIGFLWLVWLVLTSRDPKGALFALLEGSSGVRRLAFASLQNARGPGQPTDFI
jgi:hypothetical protein